MFEAGTFQRWGLVYMAFIVKRYKGEQVFVSSIQFDLRINERSFGRRIFRVVCPPLLTLQLLIIYGLPTLRYE